MSALTTRPLTHNQMARHCLKTDSKANSNEDGRADAGSKANSSEDGRADIENEAGSTGGATKACRGNKRGEGKDRCQSQPDPTC